MATTSNNDHESAKWTKDEVDAFVKCMVEEVKKGNKTTSNFNQAGWNNIETQLEAEVGRPFQVLQLRNKMNKLRMDYSSFKKLLETSGFGWNSLTRTCIVEDDDVWERHIKENPSWSRFKRNGLPQWPELQMIFGDSYASEAGGVGNAQDHNLDEEDESDMGMSESDMGMSESDAGNADGDGDSLSDTHDHNLDEEDESDMGMSESDMVMGVSDAGNADRDGNALSVTYDHNLDEEDESDMGMSGSDAGNAYRYEDAISVTHRLGRTPNATRKRSRTTELAVAIMDTCDLSRARMERYTSYLSPSAHSGSTDYSLRECIKVLDAMPEIGKELYVKAVLKMVNNQPLREAFLCVPMEKKMWLLEKLE